MRRKALGFGCDQLGVLLSEQFFSEPDSVLAELWRALGLQPSQAPSRLRAWGVAAPLRAPRGQPASHVPRAPFTEGHRRHHMLPATRALLRAFYSAQQSELARRLPTLDIARWWDNQTVQLLYSRR